MKLEYEILKQLERESLNQTQLRKNLHKGKGYIGYMSIKLNQMLKKSFIKLLKTDLRGKYYIMTGSGRFMLNIYRKIYG